MFPQRRLETCPKFKTVINEAITALKEGHKEELQKRREETRIPEKVAHRQLEDVKQELAELQKRKVNEGTREIKMKKSKEVVIKRQIRIRETRKSIQHTHGCNSEEENQSNSIK